MDKERIYRVKVKIWDRKLKKWIPFTSFSSEDIISLNEWINDIKKVKKEKFRFWIDMFIKWGRGKPKLDSFLKRF